jgi:hypothetical protein
MRFLIPCALLLLLSACAETIKDAQRRPGNDYGPVSSLGEDCYKDAIAILDKEITVQAALRTR